MHSSVAKRPTRLRPVSPLTFSNPQVGENILKKSCKNVLPSRSSKCLIQDIEASPLLIPACKPSEQVNIHVHANGVTCPACEYLELSTMQDDFAELPFAAGYPLWLEAHRPFITARTHEDYEKYGKPLLAFYKNLQLRHIGIGSIRGYQFWRWKRGSVVYGETQSKFTHNAETVRIKNEINCVLKPMLIQAGLWAAIKEKKFKHLPVPREGSGTPLNTEEQELILAVGFSKKKWVLATHCQRIMYRTGTLFGELRKVKRKHIDLKRGTVTIIEGAKNSGPRLRTVTLIPSALESMEWIVKRFEDTGGSSEQYVLFHRVKGLDVPMGSTYRSWVAILDATLERHKENAELCAKLEETRQCDGRTSAACNLLINAALSLPTIEKSLGWSPSSGMRKRYYQADHNTQRNALLTLEVKK